MKKMIACFVLAFVPALPFFGCDAVDQAFDCADICNRYADCYDEGYDVDACVSKCRDKADKDREYSDAASDCETCLDDRSCKESNVCADDCLVILPDNHV